jgi:hypothetical protein
MAPRTITRVLLVSNDLMGYPLLSNNGNDASLDKDGGKHQQLADDDTTHYPAPGFVSFNKIRALI